LSSKMFVRPTKVLSPKKNVDLFSRVNNENKYSFIKTSDKPQINTRAATGISDAGAAPVGHRL